MSVPSGNMKGGTEVRIKNSHSALSKNSWFFDQAGKPMCLKII